MPRTSFFNRRSSIRLVPVQPARGTINKKSEKHGRLRFRTVPEGLVEGQTGSWSYSPDGLLGQNARARTVGDIHFSFLAGQANASFWVCVKQRGRPNRWLPVLKGFSHPLYPSHVLYQRAKSPPSWILRTTFASYTRHSRSRRF
ncbi:hypothetical protein FRC12_024840 [Ceratobasidium sp. 428]|nr:hypothetical protein FRC12_024840 [Ceratobasidium sp. 428]